jgi:hypothetical protein
MWARAVWEEGNKIQEGVVPKVWIENNTVRWPSGLNVKKPYAEKQTPCDNWKTFPLIKIKCSAGQSFHYSWKLFHSNFHGIEDKIRITA